MSEKSSDKSASFEYLLLLYQSFTRLVESTRVRKQPDRLTYDAPQSVKKAAKVKKAVSKGKGKSSKSAKGKKTQKKKKDPNAPKRPMSAYFFFQADVRPEVDKKHPNASVTEKAAIIGKMWSELSAADKKVLSLVFFSPAISGMTSLLCAYVGMIAQVMNAFDVFFSPTRPKLPRIRNAMRRKSPPTRRNPSLTKAAPIFAPLFCIVFLYQQFFPESAVPFGTLSK
jgi:hypothetical protein